MTRYHETYFLIVVLMVAQKYLPNDFFFKGTLPSVLPQSEGYIWIISEQFNVDSVHTIRGELIFLGAGVGVLIPHRGYPEAWQMLTETKWSEGFG